jgi:hypothetical protein
MVVSALSTRLDGIEAPTPQSRRPQATQHRVDALGVRLLGVEPRYGGAIELLEFADPFRNAPEFEHALRQRVTQLSGFHHAAFADTQAVERFDDGSLVLISRVDAGRRLTDLIGVARGPAFAIALVTQLLPALHALQQWSSGFSHGLLTSDRIVVTPAGRLIIVEAPLGGAVEGLGLSPARLREDFGLAVPDDESGSPRLDARRDIIELGMMTLALLLERRVDPAAFPTAMTPLLAEVAGLGHDAAALVPWLASALQQGEQSFDSAEPAWHAWRKSRTTPAIASSSASVSEPTTAAPAPVRDLSEDDAMTTASTTDVPSTPEEPAGAEPPPTLANGASPADAEPIPAAQPASPLDTPAAGPPAAAADARPEPEPESEPLERVAAVVSPSRRRWQPTLIRLGFIAFGVLAAAEGGVILKLSRHHAATAAVEASPNPPSNGNSSPTAAVGDGATRPADDQSSPIPAVPPAVGDMAAHTTLPPTTVTAGNLVNPAVSTGQAEITAAVPLQILEGDHVLGVSGSAIALPPGPHTLDLVNAGLGVRIRKVITIREGQTMTAAIALPTGRISVNAVPWADVSIDGASVGQTPLANVTLPLGTHTVVFRNPDLGERRQTVTVRAGEPARISEVFDHAN